MIDKIIAFLFKNSNITNSELCEGLKVRTEDVSADIRSLYQDGYIKMGRKEVKKPTGNSVSVPVYRLGAKGSEYYHTVIEKSHTLNTLESNQAPDENSKKIFISHAFSAKSIANKLIDKIIVPNFSLTKDQDIFFTSNRQMGIRSSLNWRNKIKNSLKECQIFIAIITPDFKISEMCLGEIGAAWILNKSIHPLIVPPVELSNFNTVISELQAEDLSNKNNIHAFINSLGIDLLNHYQINRIQNVDIETQTQSFYSFINKIRKELKKPHLTSL